MKQFLNFSLILVFSTLIISSCAPDPQVRIGIIGNSITQGSGLPDPLTQAYPVQLGAMLAEIYDSAYVVKNFGLTTTTMLKNGDVSYWNTQEFQAYLEYAPDICFIMLGTNDTKPQNWDVYGNEYFDDYMAMIDTIKQINPDTKFIFGYPPPVYEDRWGIRDTIVVNGLIPAIDSVLSLVDAELMDFYHPLLDSSHLFPDKIHPNVEGAGVMAKLLFDRLQELNIVK